VTGLQPALPREHYVDAATWARERDTVLAGSWLCIGRAHELGLDEADRLAVVEVLGESVLLTTDGDGELHAHGNVCRHRGAQVVPHPPGSPPVPRPAKALRCGYHSWTYGCDGRLLKAPFAEHVEGFEKARFGLPAVGVGSWGGFVFACLRPAEASRLEEELGGVPQRTRRYPLAELVSARHLRYEVAANWKVIAENYNECYHCAGVHPELTRLVPDFGRGGTDLDWAGGIGHRPGAWTFSFSGTSPRPPFPGLDGDERVKHKGELVYPNLLLSLSAEHVAAFALAPLAAGRTRIDVDILVGPDQLGHDIEDCAGFWDLVNRQDWAVCESVQRGMSSRFYEQGWYAPMEDASLDIRGWLLSRLKR
jgi:Rieske 2Fe-2S family protein